MASCPVLTKLLLRFFRAVRMSHFLLSSRLNLTRTSRLLICEGNWLVQKSNKTLRRIENAFYWTFGDMDELTIGVIELLRKVDLSEQKSQVQTRPTRWRIKDLNVFTVKQFSSISHLSLPFCLEHELQPAKTSISISAQKLDGSEHRKGNFQKGSDF